MTGIVYLIDDEPDFLALLCELVELAGLETQGYSRASDFFEKVKVLEPNSLLVLDLHMPGMDGIEVMRILAKMSNPPALILVSGADNGVLHSAEKLGRAHNLEILSCLSKPVPTKQFIQLLEQWAPRIGTGYQRSEVESPQQNITSADLQRAINNDELILHYQPQVDISTSKLLGVEALIRWKHPKYGLIYPDQFIPLAERHGLIGKLTHWLIDESIHQQRQWHDAGLRLVLSLNISAVDITSLTLPEQISGLLKANKLDPTQITLEVTESALMGELVTSLDILTRLRLKGLGLSIDDFGTGYSSLVQLHRAPFDELKIDRSFVSNMLNDDEAKTIVKTCILLGHELEMTVVAEGVEDQDTWGFLANLGCDVAQGHFIARPMPADDLNDWIMRWERQRTLQKQLHV